MTIETLLAVLTIIGATAVMIAGGTAFLWRRFNSVYDKMDDLFKGVYDKIDHNRRNHDQNFQVLEDKQSDNHGENQRALEAIRLCLAKAGLWNGAPRHP